ncbi:2-C-methyl-D-erythritol 2,4-cyclodiphosphate synthase [Anaplasma phagocytophilum]|uniref:2-C-methyl-D-erythritol 2,4-cyclodiphosphate synthase n=1 Tax=Anaplasma phagocytophilum TaxID=948 RepID=UPI0005C469B2|nr:2-C-methyl-D-erythritol 2,4-cyclodiphosphate synthase [Anaplasma phagocytophilum]
MPFRVGMGFDVHRFTESREEGQYIPICGIKVVHTQGIVSHSDGDVALHALTDALLGCMGEGSIGQHFPNSDPQWRNASSSYFLLEAQKKAAAKSYAILNFDVTIVCEQPKIMPHVPKMKEFLSKLLDVDVSQMNIKAVTTEKLGFLGRGEGIAAHAVLMCYRV